MGLFLLVIGFSLIGGLIVHDIRQAKRRLALWENFSTRHAGLLPPRFSWLGSVTLEYRGLANEVRQTSTGSKFPVFYLESSLELRALNPEGLRVEVYPKALFSSLGKLMGMQDLEIGHPDFDERYILKSNDLVRLTALLDAPARRAVDELYDLFGNQDCYLHLDRRQVQVKTRKRADTQGEIDRFYQQALLLFDAVLRVLETGRLLEARPSQIRFLPGGTEAPASPLAEEIRFLPDGQGLEFVDVEGGALPTISCPVCGEDLDGRVNVACQRCDACHHYECWEFSGACTTYGCSSKRYRDA